jgi:hypothetical protein
VLVQLLLQFLVFLAQVVQLIDPLLCAGLLKLAHELGKAGFKLMDCGFELALPVRTLPIRFRPPFRLSLGLTRQPCSLERFLVCLGLL